MPLQAHRPGPGVSIMEVDEGAHEAEGEDGGGHQPLVEEPGRDT